MLKDAIRTAIVLLAFGAAAFAQTPVGPNFQVNSYTTGLQGVPSIGVEPDGDFVVVWTSQGQDGSGYGAFGQRFEASGAPRGSEFRINTYTTGFQAWPDVAVGSAGDFVVVWTSGQDGSSTSIQGRRYDASGNPVGGEFQVNTYTTGSQGGAHVARAADGRFVVAWTSDPDGDSSGISARRFDASGNPIGDEFVVNTSTSGPQFGGDVASDANGNFVVMWQSYYGGYPQFSDLYGQNFDAAGNPVGAEFSMNLAVGDDSPSISAAPSGAFVVAWTGTFGYYTRLPARRVVHQRQRHRRQHVHTGRPGRGHRGDRPRRQRQLHRHVVWPRPERPGRRLRPALRRGWRSRRPGVQGQHRHDRAQGDRWSGRTLSATSSWPGPPGMGRTATYARSASATCSQPRTSPSRSSTAPTPSPWAPTSSTRSP